MNWDVPRKTAVEMAVVKNRPPAKDFLRKNIIKQTSPKNTARQRLIIAAISVGPFSPDSQNKKTDRIVKNIKRAKKTFDNFIYVIQYVQTLKENFKFDIKFKAEHSKRVIARQRPAV